MIPYPDVSRLPEELANAVCRMVRLVNEMRRRHPGLDRMALSADSVLDAQAAVLVARHVDRLGIGFDLLVSPYDPAHLPHQAPLPGTSDGADGSG